MANGVDEILPREVWEASNHSHKQCIKNLLQLIEVGDIDPKVPGLPSRPKMDRFKPKYLNE